MVLLLLFFAFAICITLPSCLLGWLLLDCWVGYFYLVFVVWLFVLLLLAFLCCDALGVSLYFGLMRCVSLAAVLSFMLLWYVLVFRFALLLVGLILCLQMFGGLWLVLIVGCLCSMFCLGAF